MRACVLTLLARLLAARVPQGRKASGVLQVGVTGTHSFFDLVVLLQPLTEGDVPVLILFKVQPQDPRAV